MRVLWFTGVTPVEFSECLGRKQSVIQGWVPSLINAVRKYANGIRLTVACCDKCPARATVNDVDYIALGPHEGKSTKDFAKRVQECVQ